MFKELKLVLELFRRRIKNLILLRQERRGQKRSSDEPDADEGVDALRERARLLRPEDVHHLEVGEV